jgi:hypothetical protein
MRLRMTLTYGKYKGRNNQYFGKAQSIEIYGAQE